MHRRVVKTYGKQPVANRLVSSSKLTLTNYCHAIFDSSDSDGDGPKTNENNHINEENPFESTFDRIAKDVKLPPMTLDDGSKNSILYVSSSSSSSLSDENWVQNIEKSPKIQRKKIIERKCRKKIDLDQKVYTKQNRVKEIRNTKRKKPNNSQDINTDKVEKVQESLPPQRKTRRSRSKHFKEKTNFNSNESSLNLIPIIQSSMTKDLKSCTVDVTRANMTEQKSESSNTLHSYMNDNANTQCIKDSTINKTINETSMMNQQHNNFSMIKDCHIVLPRLSVKSIPPFKKCDFDMTMISSTPFVQRINPVNLKPSISPIDNKFHNTNGKSNTIEISDASEIHDTKNDETNKTFLSDVYSSPYIKTQMSDITDEKLTQTASEIGDTIDNIDYRTHNIVTPSSKHKLSINLMKKEKIEIQPLSLSPDENQSRSMFNETQPEINDVTNLSCSNVERHEDSYESEKSYGEKNDYDEISEEGGLKSSTSISQTINSIKTMDTSQVDSTPNEYSELSNKDTSEESYNLLISNESSIEKNSSKINPIEIMGCTVNSSDNSRLNMTNIDNEINTSKITEPFVLLTRLSPVQITRRRDKYVNWGDNLSRISESSERRESTSIPLQSDDEISLRKSYNDQNNVSMNKSVDSVAGIRSRVSRRTRFSVKNRNDESKQNESIGNDENKMVFLKPGKSWARSLSILNHINNNDDIEMLSIGKGKKWRKSVKSVLDMQSQSALQTCIRNNENDNDQHVVSYGIHRNDITRISSSALVGAVESTSPCRFVRRVSIRVVPNNKYSIIEDTEIGDTSFLDVYGIPTSKNRETLGNKRSTLISANQDTFVYNLRCSNVDIAANSPEPVIAAKNAVLQRCSQTDCMPFEEYYPEKFLEQCRKIGEGVYGEVFLYESKKEKSVIKIIPIEGEKLVNGEPQKKFCEILSEIIIAKELHNLRYHDVYRTSGFIEVKNIRCLMGKYPQKLIDHWEAYDEEKSSDNDCPSMFSDEQLYVVLELGHGGQDLEAFVFQNATEAYTSFIQAALSLAVAEKSLEFEHRDLHWGNILISRTDDVEMSYKLDTEEIILPCKGLKVAIIDFTLSRMSYQGCCMFNDLALDSALFTAVGEYQFEIYRLMKAKVANNWQLFEPYTNILWLHYTLDKMITSVRYKKKTTKIHKNGILKLQELKDIILDYDSAYDFITNCKNLSNLQRKNSHTK